MNKKALKKKQALINHARDISLFVDESLSQEILDM